MKTLIFGGSGMLGHKLAQVLRKDFEVYVTVRKPNLKLEGVRTIENIDVENLGIVEGIVRGVHPDVIINAVGIVKQSLEVKNVVKALTINSIFPHRLAQFARDVEARFITISTDCVFKGNKGNYTEEDIPDAEDIYGKSKQLGEVREEGCLTIRTSIIGRELDDSKGLVEWFLSQKGKTIKGYRKAMFNGFPTIVLSEILKEIIKRHNSLSGLYHISSEPISKYDLLSLLKAKLNFDVEIEASDEIQIDRSLNSERFRKETGFKPESWEKMIDKMIEDFEWYERVRVCRKQK